MPPIFIPDTINIGNREVAVMFEDLSEMNAMGFYDPQNFRIVINSQIENRTAIVETFWHELMHAIFDFTRFGLEMQMEMADDDTPEEDAFRFEERMSEGFAKTLLQVIQDNNLTEVTS